MVKNKYDLYTIYVLKRIYDEFKIDRNVNIQKLFNKTIIELSEKEYINSKTNGIRQAVVKTSFGSKNEDIDIFIELVSNWLIDNDQTLHNSLKNKNDYNYFFESPENFDTELLFQIDNMEEIKDSIKATNIIYFGSPGTGKSTKANDELKENDIPESQYKRITFHPEYDYGSFVGGYKPTMKDGDITYSFVPQVFTKIYVDAWKEENKDKRYYLIIEEINRGNCAEIFGDLFQLLDRDDDGSSIYSIDASQDLQAYLEQDDILGIGHGGIKSGKLKLPSNLYLVATMNTSDQSLFPMDSAFKRRWDWEHISINYDCLISKKFKINIGDYSYNWLEFLHLVNKKIVEATQSQDKQIGNWFIKGDIDEKVFINKVLFYLWNDVFKDEEETIFELNNNTLYYEDFFKNDSTQLILDILDKNLQVSKVAVTV